MRREREPAPASRGGERAHLPALEVEGLVSGEGVLRVLVLEAVILVVVGVLSRLALASLRRGHLGEPAVDVVLRRRNAPLLRRLLGRGGGALVLGALGHPGDGAIGEAVVGFPDGAQRRGGIAHICEERREGRGVRSAAAAVPLWGGGRAVDALRAATHSSSNSSR